MNNNEWLAIDVLEDYLDGKLDAKTMHRVERISLEDPFVAEALAGLSASPKRVQSLSLLQKQLQERIAQKPVQEKRWQITSHRLSIAAAAAVLFVTVSLLFWMRENNNRKKVEVTIAAAKEPTKPNVKTKEEVEKVITEAKKTSYASNSRKKTDKLLKSSTVAPVVVPPVPLENADESTSSKSFEIQEKKEVLSKQLPSALAGKVAGLKINDNLIKGVVYGDDKLPISGASVKLNGTSQGTTTDRNGQFSLRLDSLLKSKTLNVAYIGFMPKEVAINKNENLAIELKPNNATLNEVVVVGYGTAKKKMSTASSTALVVSLTPTGGWDKFEEYILNTNKLLVDKKQTGRDIILSFEVNERGEPVNIKMVNNANLTPKATAAEEGEAIRLLKDGPKWILPVKSNPSTTHTVNIKF